MEKGYAKKVIAINVYMLQGKANRRCKTYQSAHCVYIYIHVRLIAANKYFPHSEDHILK